jgi:uncharacterized protein (DUF4415 family)
MTAKPDPFMIDEENPAWTPEATAEAKPFDEVFPGQVEKWKRGRGRPRAEAPKVTMNFRFAADVVKRVRETGPGYNARVEKLLLEALEHGKL